MRDDWGTETTRAREKDDTSTRALVFLGAVALIICALTFLI